MDEDGHDERPCTVPASRGLRRDVRIARESVFADCIHAYLRIHTRVAFAVARVATRGTNPELRESYTTHPIQPYLNCATLDCVRAAPVNSVLLVAGLQTANLEREIVHNEKRLIRNLRSLVWWMSQEGRSITNGGVASDKEWNRLVSQTDRQAALYYMARKPKAVFIVLLRDVGRVDHAVTTILEERFIVDFEERQVLKLSPSVLERCGGGDTSKIRLQEVRCVELCAEGCGVKEREKLEGHPNSSS